MLQWMLLGGSGAGRVPLGRGVLFFVLSRLFYFISFQTFFLFCLALPQLIALTGMHRRLLAVGLTGWAFVMCLPLVFCRRRRGGCGATPSPVSILNRQAQPRIKLIALVP